MRAEEVTDAVRKHLHASADHEAFARRVLSRAADEDLGWALVAVFYAALHAVRAYFATHGAEVSSHEEGESQFRKRPEISRSFVKYKALKEMSEGYRYFHDVIPREQVVAALASLGSIRSMVDGQTRRRCPDAFAPDPPKVP